MKMPKEFKAISTQEEFDNRIKERLEQQDRKYADYDQLKEKNEKLETEVGKLQTVIDESNEATKNHDQTISDLNAKIAGYETASLRTRIALQNGLPIDLAERLVGNDEESIKADAERLAGFVKAKETIPPLKNTEPTLDEGKDGAYKSLIENLNLEGE